MRFLNALLVLIFFLSGCSKDDPPTIIKGKVTDRKTGSAIEEAQFRIDISTGVNSTTSEYFYTDSKGEFNYTLENLGSIIGSSGVFKPGYVGKTQLDLQTGKENVLNISLLPADAFLKVIVSNESGDPRPIYLQIVNPVIGAESNRPPYYLYVKDYPITLSKNEVHEEIFDLPESTTYLYWDFHLLDPTKSASFQDSVTVSSNDTINFKITY